MPGSGAGWVSARRSTAAATDTSIVTLPTVRMISGSTSTATSSASGPTGTPIASAIGPIALAMGVPLGPLALLVAVEVRPDIIRTVGNVTMDVAVAAAVDRRALGDPAPESEPETAMASRP